MTTGATEICSSRTIWYDRRLSYRGSDQQNIYNILLLKKFIPGNTGLWKSNTKNGRLHAYTQMSIGVTEGERGGFWKVTIGLSSLARSDGYLEICLMVIC